MDAAWWYERDCDTLTRQGLLARSLHRCRSEFQEIEILEHDRLGRVLVLDGIVQTTQADEFVYHEMLSHVPLLGRSAAAEPSTSAAVLIIGGGDGGTLREVLRHPFVTRVEMVEIDGVVIETCKEFLGFHGDYSDPRVTLHIDDGADFIRSAQARGDLFDVILVDSTDPLGGPGDRLFSPEFLDSAARCLRDNGILARHFGVPFPDLQVLINGVANMGGALGHVQVYRAAVPTYIGGDMAFALSSRAAEDCSRPHAEFSGRYYNPQLHSAAFVLPSFWRESLQG